jgi:hypothetical protein
MPPRPLELGEVLRLVVPPELDPRAGAGLGAALRAGAGLGEALRTGAGLGEALRGGE